MSFQMKMYDRLEINVKQEAIKTKYYTVSTLTVGYIDSKLRES